MANQFLTLQNWTFEVLETIKKDLKSDHLHTDPLFYQKHFGRRPQNRLSVEEILTAYEKELVEGHPEIAEFVVNRWVFKHGDLYQHFADRLSKIHPNFDEIKQLTPEQSKQVLQGAAETFGAVPTFLFCVLNGVVFPPTILEELRRGAEVEKSARLQKEETEAERDNLQKVIEAHQREVARLHDKIAGVQKKYVNDTEALKKQIKSLQQKLHGPR